MPRCSNDTRELGVVFFVSWRSFARAEMLDVGDRFD